MTKACFPGEVRCNEPLAFHTTMRVGGPAAYFFLPETAEALSLCLAALQNAGIPFFILGGGSNVVFPDAGFDGAVIGTEHIDFLEAVPDSDKVLVRCGAGCKMETLVDYCLQHRLRGLEAFAGLPGTTGGAVYMNARCYEKSVSDALASTEYLTQGDGGAWSVRQYVMNAAGWDYKKSPFQGQSWVILSTVFAVQPCSEAKAAACAERAAFFREDRRKKQHFDFPSAGSVFKNNRDFGQPSGQLIDEAGLRGCQIGGAQVAPWHGNIIINTGNATAGDIQRLVRYVAGVVFEKTGFHLEPEIVFVY